MASVTTSQLLDFKHYLSVQLSLTQMGILENAEYILISIRAPLIGLQFIKCYCK